VLEFLAEREQVDEVMASVEEITRRYFDRENAEVRPSDGFAVSAAFNASSEISAQLRKTYEATMHELYFGASPLPTWDAICARVAEARDSL
jgi:hypothetical protein